MPETLGDRLPAALKRIEHFLGSDQALRINRDWIADIMAIHAAVTTQETTIERLEQENRELRHVLADVVTNDPIIAAVVSIGEELDLSEDEEDEYAEWSTDQ